MCGDGGDSNLNYLLVSLSLYDKMDEAFKKRCAIAADEANKMEEQKTKEEWEEERMLDEGGAENMIRVHLKRSKRALANLMDALSCYEDDTQTIVTLKEDLNGIKYYSDGVQKQILRATKAQNDCK
jgi:hypothetical protein